MSDASYQYTSNLLVATASAAHVRARALNKRVRKTFLDLTARVQPTLTLEVGAFEADFSLWARKRLPEARVMAFEANPHAYELFREKVTAAGVEYVNACVGPETGTVTINVPRDFKGKQFELGMNQMASLRTSLVTEEHEQVEVPSVRLDDTVAIGPDDRLVAWIDVEGALEQVLPGCRETLSRASVAFVEVEDEPIWDGQWLDLDVVRWFDEIGMVPILRDMQRPGQYNLILVNEELAADPATARRAARVYSPPPPGSPDRLEAAPPAAPPSSRAQRLLQRGLDWENARLRRRQR